MATGGTEGEGLTGAVGGLRGRYLAEQDVSGPLGNLPSVLSVISAYIGIPTALNFWAPGWVIVAWLIAFTLCNAWSVVALDAMPIRLINQIWLTATGVLISIVPISLAVWGDVSEFEALALGLAIVYLASDGSVLPFMQTHVWYTGAAINMLVTLAVVLLFGTWLFTVPILFVSFSLVSAGYRSLNMRSDLESRRAAAEQDSTRDDLTGVINRRGVVRLLESFRGQPITALMVDADKFKSINDTWGHVAGDEALVQVALQLEQRLGPDWQVGRLGGDEFVAIAPGHRQLTTAVLEPVSIPLLLHTRAMTLTLHLSGGTSHIESVATTDQVLAEVTYALRAAKAQGSRRLVVLDGNLREQFHRATEVSAGVDARFGDGHFVALAQPVVILHEPEQDRASVPDHEIVGFELLARWERPDGSTIGPDDFLPVLRQNGALATLGNLMLEYAVSFAAQLASNHSGPTPFVSVNIDPSQLLSSEFAPRVAEVLVEAGVAPEQLVVEITESEALYRVDGWEGFARDLRLLGVGLAIDDFGVGYSTIERVADLPVTHIKLDRVFSSAEFDPGGQLTAGVIGFFRGSGFTVVAEGVERPDQLERLRSAGADLFQGWLFGYPEPLVDALQRFRPGPRRSHTTGDTSPVTDVPHRGHVPHGETFDLTSDAPRG